MLHLRLLALFAFTLAFIDSAFACSCITRTTLAEHVSAANYIFIGRVVAVHEIKSLPDMPSWGGVRVKFELQETIKGTRPYPKSLTTGYGSGDCGVPMFVGTSYIFFASPNGAIDICSGTKSYIKEYEPSEAYLNEIKAYVVPSKVP